MLLNLDLKHPKKISMIRMIYYYIDVFKKYNKFKGRSQRKGYLIFLFTHTLAFAVLMIADNELIRHEQYNHLAWLTTIYYLVTFVPFLSATIRRLHDVNFSGWWALLYAIPLIQPIGIIVLLVIIIQPGITSDNIYGPYSK